MCNSLFPSEVYLSFSIKIEFQSIATDRRCSLSLFRVEADTEPELVTASVA